VVEDYIGSLKTGNLNTIDSDQSPTIPSVGDIDQAVFDDKRFKYSLKKLKLKMEKFTKEWNEDDNNRDKTYTVFNQLTLTKDEMQDSLKQMLERDGKIEESLVKGA
jgi:hypothetical protein